MANRTFNIACFSSAMLLVVTLLFIISSFILNPWEHHVSLNRDFHIGVYRSRIVFFNNSEYGPYKGSIIKIDDYPVFDREIYWGDSYGIYYRYFRWQDGAVLWTLMVSLLYPLLLFIVLPSIWYWRRVRARTRQLNSEFELPPNQ